MAMRPNDWFFGLDVISSGEKYRKIRHFFRYAPVQDRPAHFYPDRGAVFAAKKRPVSYLYD
ncbi:MAG: hypothetical protein VB020_07165 [Methanocorpusculum sp.]|nr:hypothetical protein [Methanocorpusculum sp.]